MPKDSDNTSLNPLGLKLNIPPTWDMIWHEKKEYTDFLIEDQKIRKFLKRRLSHAGLSRVFIERTSEKVLVKLFIARPDIILRKKGAEIEALKKYLEHLVNRKVVLNILEVRRPEADAQLVAECIADQLERRVAFRLAMKKAVSAACISGVKGIKISCYGRLDGAEMSRCEWLKEGRVPLHTLRADIDYGQVEANTIYGVIDVKVWIFKGEIATAVASSVGGGNVPKQSACPADRKHTNDMLDEFTKENAKYLNEYKTIFGEISSGIKNKNQTIDEMGSRMELLTKKYEAATQALSSTNNEK